MGLKKITVDALVKLNAQFGPFPKVLDVGCGERIYARYLSFGKYIGIDVQDSGHDNQKKYVDLFFDGQLLPFEDNEFDLILCTEVLEHAVSPEVLLSEMKRCLSKTGHILLTVPSMWGEHETPYDFRRFTSFGVKKICADVGLTMVDFKKESVGVKALICLGLSEIDHCDAPKMIKKISILWLKFTYVIFKWILRISMSRIYLTNLAILRK